jgi:hypothetical protein
MSEEVAMRASFALRRTLALALTFASTILVLGVAGSAAADEKLTLSYEHLDRVMRAPPAKQPDALSDLPPPPAAPKPGPGTSIPPKFKPVTAGLSSSNSKQFSDSPQTARQSSLLSNGQKKAR